MKNMSPMKRGSLFVLCLIFCLIFSVVSDAFPSKSERIIELAVYLMNLESGGGDSDEHESGVPTAVEKIEAVSQGTTHTLRKEDESSFLKWIYRGACYMHISSFAGDLSGKDGYPGTMFVIHTADGNQTEISVWEQYFIVNGTAYEADETLCEAIAGFRPEFAETRDAQ